MKLTKSDIEGIRLTCFKRKYYLSEEVDGILDELAAEADRLQKELTELRDKAAQYDEASNTLSSAVIDARRSADEIIAKANDERARIIREGERKCEELLAEEKARQAKIIGDNEALIEATRELRAALSGYAREISAQLGELTGDTDEV